MYQKLFLLAVLCTALLLPVPSPSHAAATDALVELAQLFPADTDFFYAMSSDDAFIDGIDTLIGEFNDLLNVEPAEPLTAPASFQLQPDNPADDEPFTPLRDALDDFSKETFGDDFATAVRPWLGGTVAFGFTDFSEELARIIETGDADDLFTGDDVPVMLAVAITDRAAALEAIDILAAESVADGITVRIETESYTYFKDPGSPIGALVTPDAFVVGTENDLLNIIDSPGPSLLDNQDFVTVLDLMPADDYSLISYLNYNALFSNFAQLAALDPNFDPSLNDTLEVTEDILAAIQGIGIGATLLDERTLTMDFVQDVDLPALEALGFSYALPSRINTDFAEHIPENMAFVYMASNLGGLYDATIENLITQSSMLPPEAGGMTSEEINEGIEQGEFLVGAFSGLNIRNDVLSWMTSDFALVAGFTADAATITSLESIDDLPIDYGLIFDATADPDAAARTVDGLASATDRLIDLSEVDLEDAQVTITRTSETIDGDDVVVYTVVDESGFNLAFPVEVLMGSDEEVFVVGSRHVVETALAGNGTLPTTIAYTEATERYLVDDSGALMLVNFEALAPLAPIYAAVNSFDPFAESDAQLIADILAYFSSATISSTNAEDGTSSSRATISLNRP
ncbi:MAG: DUF3352 domain-containing protein [Chloroflexota bacterium]